MTKPKTYRFFLVCKSDTSYPDWAVSGTVSAFTRTEAFAKAIAKLWDSEAVADEMMTTLEVVEESTFIKNKELYNTRYVRVDEI